MRYSRWDKTITAGCRESEIHGAMRLPDILLYSHAEVFLSPLFHVFKYGNKAFSQVSEIIFHMGRDFFVIMAGNEAVRFQFPKLLCQ